MIRGKSVAALLTLALAATSCTHGRDDRAVGQRLDGGTVVATMQLVRPAGRSVGYHGRPVDLALSPDARTLYVKDIKSLLAIDTATWQIRQELKIDRGGASMHGLAVSPDGRHVYYTAVAPARVCRADVATDGTLSWARPITTAPKSDPAGIAISPDARTAYVAMMGSNTLAVIDLPSGKVLREIAVGVAPYGVALSPDAKTAYVTDWGGRQPAAGEKTAESAGAAVVVDDHGVAATGALSVVDLDAGRQVAQLPTGLHPAGLALSPAGDRLYVANANSDTVSAVDTRARRLLKTINVRPDPALPFGSISTALALSPAGDTLYVANGGNNAVAVIDTASDTLRGFIPAGWFPGAVVAHGHDLFVANVKGEGSRDPAFARRWSSKSYWGTLTRVTAPDPATLAAYTKQVKADALVPQSLAAWEKARSGAQPVPVPQRLGEPSVFQHIVYVIKENRTYDQVLGDLSQANGDPDLCTFPRRVTPNQHALAEQFVLLDNYYCNGVNSADGHQWAVEGAAVDYLEKSFGGFSRSYPFWGGDPLAFAPTGFLWDDALLHGRSFRNFGEFSTAGLSPRGANYRDILADRAAATHKIAFTHVWGTDEIRRYSCPTYPGWNLRIPDQARADIFLREFRQAEQTGRWEDLTILYFPQDHTFGTSPDMPAPDAMVADNDLAVGRAVDAISHSRFWPSTCIFVIEDDPQAGFDHVDGHRSTVQVISPYSRRAGKIVSDFYNQTSVLHTIELMLGLPPMNQFDAMAPAMRTCFTAKPDLRPYTAITPAVDLTATNPPKTALSGESRRLAELSSQQDFTKPDAVDDDAMNRILWHAARGDATPYPAALAGAHGKGLQRLGLRLDGGAVAPAPGGGDDD